MTDLQMLFMAAKSHRELLPHRIDKASELWRAGMHPAAIAAKMGVSPATIFGLVAKRRDLFPANGRSPARSNLSKVVRITVTGAAVSVPRVTFIDGPIEEAQP